MTVFFMHIPKTAGTSFRLFLRRTIEGRGGICLPEIDDRYLDYDTFLRQGADLAAKYDLLYGHFPYHVRGLLPEPTTVVTVLRDPLERCVSHIKHQIQVALEIEGPGDTVIDINDYIASSDPRYRTFLQTIRNLTVKFLSCHGHPDVILADIDLSLYEAMKNCDSLLVGFADELETFQNYLAEKFSPDHRVECFVRRANISADSFSSKDLTPRNRAFLEDLNRLDLLLYERLKSQKRVDR